MLKKDVRRIVNWQESMFRSFVLDMGRKEGVEIDPSTGVFRSIRLDRVSDQGTRKMDYLDVLYFESVLMQRGIRSLEIHNPVPQA